MYMMDTFFLPILIIGCVGFIVVILLACYCKKKGYRPRGRGGRFGQGPRLFGGRGLGGDGVGGFGGDGGGGGGDGG